MLSDSLELPALKLASPVAAPTCWLESEAHRFGAVRLDAGLSLGSRNLHLEGRTRSLTQPCRVAVDPRGKVLALGDAAAAMEGREPCEVRVVRPLREGAVVEPELARQLVASVLRAASLPGGAHLAAAVPSDLSAVERAALEHTLKAAGAREVHLVQQTLLAALGAGLKVLEPRGGLVVHLGAETSEVSLFSLGTALHGRTMRVGGAHMDAAIIEHVRRAHQVLLDERAAEAVRCELGHAVAPEGTLEVSGQGLEDGKPTRVTLTAAEVAPVLQPFLEQLQDQLCQVLAECSPELLSDLIADGAALTGGGARFKGLSEFLGQRSRLRLVPAEAPQDAVARGLAALLKQKPLRQVLLARRQARPAPRPGSSGWLVAGLALATAAVLSVGYLGELRSGLAGPVERTLGKVVEPACAAVAPTPEPSEHTRALLVEKDRQLAELTAENERLQKLLGLQGTAGNLTALAANVVARDPKGWMSSVTLDAGTDQGLRAGCAVATDEGLVGQVIEVARSTCRVRLLTDPRAVVAGKVSGRRASGVLQGLGTASVELRYLDPDARVQSGDLVLTSGQDGLFPEGLKVGRVRSVRQVAQASYQAAVVEPLASLETMRTVLVLKPARRSVGMR
ncbi:MAG: rod shape-determining protein MreC [Candidatus Eremiobacterota bacterium]